jgi:hypothetical protein
MNRWLGTVVAVLAAGLMAGCGGADGADESTAAGADRGETGPPADLATSAEEGAEGGEADSGSAKAQPVVLLDPSSREIIYTIELTVDVEDVDAAVRQATTLAAAVGGYVASETTEGDESASLTLRVPTETHSDIVTRLEGLGEIRNRFQTAEDVTEEVVDVEARITSQRRSIDRIRALLDQAADIDDVVLIESELAARESELDSLLRRQEELAKLTALATVTVTFLGPGTDAEEAPVGFVSGLRGGWNALVDAAQVAAAVVGALLPFAIVAAAVGVPGWWGIRRRRRVAPAAPDAQSAA